MIKKKLLGRHGSKESIRRDKVWIDLEEDGVPSLALHCHCYRYEYPPVRHVVVERE